MKVEKKGVKISNYDKGSSILKKEENCEIYYLLEGSNLVIV